MENCSLVSLQDKYRAIILSKNKLKYIFLQLEQLSKFSDRSKLLELQKLNGEHIGLHSRFNANGIINYISDEMKNRVIRQIKRISDKISILIDESTSLRDTFILIVYLKCRTRSSTIYLTIDMMSEWLNQTSDYMFEALLGCLKKHGFDYEYLKENFVAFACDGESVMLGRNLSP